MEDDATVMSGVSDARGRDVAHFVDYLLQGSGIDIQQIGDQIDLEALGDYFQQHPFPEEVRETAPSYRKKERSPQRRSPSSSPRRAYIQEPLPPMDALREIDSDTSDTSSPPPKAHSPQRRFRKRVDGIDDDEEDEVSDHTESEEEAEERWHRRHQDEEAAEPPRGASRERSASPYHHRTHRHHASDAVKYPSTIEKQQHSTKLLDAVSKRLVQAGYPPLPSSFPHTPADCSTVHFIYLAETLHSLTRGTLQKDKQLTALLHKVSEAELRDAKTRVTLREAESALQENQLLKENLKQCTDDNAQLRRTISSQTEQMSRLTTALTELQSNMHKRTDQMGRLDDHLQDAKEQIDALKDQMKAERENRLEERSILTEERQQALQWQKEHTRTLHDVERLEKILAKKDEQMETLQDDLRQKKEQQQQQVWDDEKLLRDLFTLLEDQEGPETYELRQSLINDSALTPRVKIETFIKAIRRRIRTLSTAEQGPPPKQASRRASTVPAPREEKTLSRSVSQKKLSQTPARSEQSIASDKGPSVKRHETRLRIARDRAAWAKQKASNSDVHEEIVMEEGSPKHSVDPLPAQAKIARRTASHSPRRSHAPIQQDREVQELKDAHALIRRMLGLRQDDDLISAIRHMTDVVLALGGMQIFVDEIRRVAWIDPSQSSALYRDAAIRDEERAEGKTFGAGKTLRETKQKLIAMKEDGLATEAKLDNLIQALSSRLHISANASAQACLTVLDNRLSEVQQHANMSSSPHQRSASPTRGFSPRRMDATTRIIDRFCDAFNLDPTDVVSIAEKLDELLWSRAETQAAAAQLKAILPSAAAMRQMSGSPGGSPDSRAQYEDGNEPEWTDAECILQALDILKRARHIQEEQQQEEMEGARFYEETSFDTERSQSPKATHNAHLFA